MARKAAKLMQFSVCKFEEHFPKVSPSCPLQLPFYFNTTSGIIMLLSSYPLLSTCYHNCFISWSALEAFFKFSSNTLISIFAEAFTRSVFKIQLASRIRGARETRGASKYVPTCLESKEIKARDLYPPICLANRKLVNDKLIFNLNI
jgi:hypothetical protein